MTPPIRLKNRLAADVPRYYKPGITDPNYGHKCVGGVITPPYIDFILDLHRKSMYNKLSQRKNPNNLEEIQ